MAQVHYLMLVLCLILTKVLSSSADLISITPAASPSQSNDNNLYKIAQTPSVRKLGKHLLSKSSDAPASSPTPASANLAPETEEDVNILEQHIHLKKHHRSVDRSVAGGGVILGGLATTFLVAVFCYIRATARHKGAETSGAQISS